MKPIIPKSRSVAFTLLEIMIAMAIFSMITLGIYTSWSAIINASRIGLDAASEAQRKRNALEAVQTALFGVQMYTANVRHHYFLADTAVPEAALLSFVAQLPESFPGSGFYPGDPVRRVTFAIDADDKGGQSLVLYQTPVLASVEEMSEPIPIRLARNVAAFSAEFYDEQNDEWLIEWDSTNSLPKQVRFSLEFENRNNQDVIVAKSDVETRVVTIPSAAIPIQIQRPSVGRSDAGMRTRGPGDANQARPGNNNNRNGGVAPNPGSPIIRGNPNPRGGR